MAIIEIASKAPQALVLPSLLISFYLERHSILTTVTKTFISGEVLPEGGQIRLAYENGLDYCDEELVEHLIKLATKGQRQPVDAVVEEWVERSSSFRATDFNNIRRPFEELNDHLISRSLIVGYDLTIADLAVWGTIRGNRIAYSSVRKTQNNVARWYSFIENQEPWIADIVKQVTASTTKDRAAASKAGANFEIDLPSVEGPMVTRFPPEPSGYLHIGHAKAALLNDYFAHKEAGGTLICRFDDTNPSKESMEFQDAIIHDLKLMEVYPDKVTYSSDNFQAMYDYAIQLIKDGKAFADDSELGKGDENRKNRLPSKRRELGIQDTLAHFAEMKTGSEEGQRWCIRARIAYDSPNGTLRDPVIYRCNLIPHHRTGTEWKIYPTYDFCAPILDSIEGVTVALRTNEYRDRNAQYDWMQEALQLRKVKIWDFSRLNFVRTLLSKRKLTRIVQEDKVWGWDDPRMPTIRGIVRRGMTVAALRDFILKQGPSRNVLNLEWAALWSANKKEIDPVAPRYTAILKDGAVNCHITGGSGMEVTSQLKHKKNPVLGKKKVILNDDILIEFQDAQTFDQDEEITLMNWGNAYIRRINKNCDGKVADLELELHLQGDVKKTKKKITWLAKTPDNLIPIELIAFDYLITKDKLEKEDELEDFLTPTTEYRSSAFADCNMADLPQGSTIQFERKGYFKLDGANNSDHRKLIFFEIPTGKSEDFNTA